MIIIYIDIMQERVIDMTGTYENYTVYIGIMNLIFILISMLLAVVVLIVAVQMRTHSRRMGWFLTAILITIGGLTFQIEAITITTKNPRLYLLASWVMYSIVAPIFGLYFIETERGEGQKWDGRFWTTLQSLVAILVILFAVYGKNLFMLNVVFMFQYLVVMIMLLISSKNIRASIGFLLGTIFPVISAMLGMLDTRLDTVGFGIIMLLLIVFFGYQVDTERELLVKEVELSDNKVSLLMEQIHPHFIYNSLQQIALLCDEDPAKVKNAIFSFSGYLRKNFEALTNEGMIPFSQELEHVDTYIALAEILPSRNFVVEKDLEVEDFYLPALVVQPLVENAILYGIGMSTEGDRIVLSTRREGGYIVIKVSDDGHGVQTQLPTQKKRKSVGTQNVKTRLKILCQGELSINKTPEGTDAVIRIPEMLAVAQK